MGVIGEVMIEAALAACVIEHPIALEAPLRRVVLHAAAESGQQQFIVGVNKDDARRLPPESRTFSNATEAAAYAWVKREDEGRRIDVGLMQISDANWAAMGLDYDNMFDVGPNVCAGARILGAAYARAINRWAACEYNTGRQDCRSPSGTNGYPERVDGARAVRVQPVLAVIPRRGPPPPQPMTPQPFDIFDRHEGREESTPQQENE